MRLDGLHHVTAITTDIAANVDFYDRLLGLRLSESPPGTAGAARIRPTAGSGGCR